MSGILAQFGFAQETRGSVPNVTGITSVPGVPNGGTIAFDADHGLAVGDRITLSGFTPSGWNGTFTIVDLPATDEVTIYTTGSVAVADSTVEGTATATAWGVAATPNRFLEVSNESLVVNPGRIQGTGIHAGDIFDAGDRQVVYPQDSTGSIAVELWDKGMEFIWLNILGDHAVSGPTDSAYTHTFTPGILRGLGLTAQIGRPDALGTVWPFTYKGCKITKAVLEVAVDAIATLTLDLDGQPAVLTTPLATPSWATGVNLLTYIGGSLEVASAAFPGVINKVTITIENNLKVDRRGLGSSTKLEQLDSQKRKITVSADAEFADLSMWNRFTSTTPAGSMASLVFSLQGPSVIGAGSTYPSLTVTLPKFRIDGSTPVVTGAELLMQNLTGPALNSAAGTNDAITVEVVSGASAL